MYFDQSYVSNNVYGILDYYDLEECLNQVCVCYLGKFFGRENRIEFWSVSYSQFRGKEVGEVIFMQKKQYLKRYDVIQKL